jgi:TolB protein
MFVRFMAIAICLSGFFRSGELQAQDNVNRIYFDTLTTREVQARKIGVEEMKYVGATYISAADSTIMQYATGVIQRDLDFYAEFDLVIIDSFYLRTYEIKELDMLGWARLGAEYLVRLEAEFPGSKLRVRWRLFDTSPEQEIAKGTLENDRFSWRQLSHQVANEIVRTLTGDQGPFLTQIAYIRKMGKAKEVFVADYDGANERQVTKTGSTNLSPTFSPDGREIYFTSFLDGQPHLYRVSTEGGKPVKVAGFPGIVAAPAISPDGSQIACVLSKDGNSEIYTIDRQGAIIKRLTNHRAIDTSPTWSPDGRMIAFTSDRSGSPQVYIMNADGNNTRRLTPEGDYNDSPIWSARGNRVTFVSRTPRGRFDLASIDTSGEGYRILTDLGTNENPHFSPDGKHIIFSSTRLGTGDLFTADLSGRNQRRLTRTGDCSNPTWGPMR